MTRYDWWSCWKLSMLFTGFNHIFRLCFTVTSLHGRFVLTKTRLYARLGLSETKDTLNWKMGGKANRWNLLADKPWNASVFLFFPPTCSLLFPSLLVWTLVWGKGERKSSLLLQTVPLDKSINAVFKNPCSLMYRFVLLSVGFSFF